MARDDAEWYEQGTPCPSQNGSAHVASTAAVVSVSAPLAHDDEQPSLNVDNDFDKGFAFSRLLTHNIGRGFHPTPAGSP